MIVLNVNGLPFLLAEALCVARTIDNGAEQIEALTTFSLATLVLAEGRTTAVLTGVLASTVLANSFATTIRALGLLFAMRTNLTATTLNTALATLTMRTNRAAATLNTALAPLQMHALDGWHSVCNTRTKANEVDTSGMPQHTFD